MGRLSNLKPSLSTLAPRLGYQPGDEKARNARRSDLPWRQWYKTTRWRHLRWAVLIRDLFTCQMCGRVEANTSRLVAHHRIPHHGNEQLFWDAENLMTACKPCHDGPLQEAERNQH